MKKIFFTLLMLCSISCFSQMPMPIDTITKKITFQEVVEVPNISAEKLYLKAKEWFSNTFVSSKNVIDLDDSKSFKIIGKGVINIVFKNSIGTTGNGGIVDFKISIFLKDNKYKYTISDFVHNSCQGMSVTSAIGGNLENEKPICGRALPMKYWDQVHNETQIQINQLVLSLKKFMASKDTSEGW